MRSPRRLSLLHKGLLLIAIPMLYQAILMGVMLKQQKTHEESQRDLVKTKTVVQKLEEIHTLLIISQGHLRLFMLGSDPVYREKAEQAGRDARVELLKLAEMVRDDPAQEQRVQNLKHRVGARVAYTSEVGHAFVSGNKEEAIGRVQRLEGQQLMDAVAQAVREIREGENTRGSQRIQEIREAATRQNALLIGGLILSLLVAGGAAILFTRNIGARLNALSENMRRIGRGETLPAAMGGNDEIGELDKGLHLMAGDLAQAQSGERATQYTLEKRNAELVRANRELDHKNQENEMFVYSVSHDLRSPLVNLQGFSKELGLVRDDLKKLFEGKIDEDARERGLVIVNRDVAESIHYIQTAVTRLSAIIDALLRLSRAGRIEYQPEIVNLEEVVDRVILAMRASIEQRGASVSRLELPSVWGDPTALEQIFANLIGNAVNYLSPDRKGVIEVSRVATPPQEFEEMMVFAVKDNGMGIPEAYQPKVFAVFQRLLPDMAPGEGIGLPLVRRMVERHGGKIWLESEEGAGTTFFVALPPKAQSPLIIAPRKESIRFSSRA